MLLFLGKFSIFHVTIFKVFKSPLIFNDDVLFKGEIFSAQLNNKMLSTINIFLIIFNFNILLILFYINLYQFMYKKTILITGANGEIGQSLIKYFQSENKYKIIALDISGNLHDLNIEKFITGSITDKKLLEKIFNKNKIDAVYHLAAILSSKAELNQELAYDVNVNGSKNIINFSVNSKNNIQFFFPSSIAVYNTQNITKTIKTKQLKF